MDWLGQLIGSLFGARPARAEVIPMDSEGRSLVEQTQKSNPEMMRLAQKRPQKVYVYGGQAVDPILLYQGLLGLTAKRGDLETAGYLTKKQPMPPEIRPEDFVVMAGQPGNDYMGPFVPTDPQWPQPVFEHEMGHFLANTETNPEFIREYNKQFRLAGDREQQFSFKELMATLFGLAPTQRNVLDWVERKYMRHQDRPAPYTLPSEFIQLLKLMYGPPTPAQ